MRKAIYFNKENEDLVVALQQVGKMEVFSDYVCGLIRADLMGKPTADATLHFYLEDIKAQLETIKRQMGMISSMESKPMTTSEPISLEKDDVKELREPKELEPESKPKDAKKTLLFV